MGLKENVILGHLIPAGTGFRTYQESEVRIRPQALRSPGRRQGNMSSPPTSRCWKRPATQRPRRRPAAATGNRRRPPRQMPSAEPAAHASPWTSSLARMARPSRR